MKLNIKDKIKKITYLFSRKIYYVLLLFLFIDLIFASIVVLEYYYFSERGKPTLFISIQINEGLLDKFYSDYQKREKVFNNIDKVIYPDLMSGPERKLTED